MFLRRVAVGNVVSSEEVADNREVVHLQLSEPLDRLSFALALAKASSVYFLAMFLVAVPGKFGKDEVVVIEFFVDELCEVEEVDGEYLVDG